MATPEGWREAALREVTAFIGRGMAPRYAVADTGVLAINQKCVRDGRVSILHARPHDRATAVKPAAVLRDGDLCVNSTGTGTIGRVGLWVQEQAKAAICFADTHVTIVRARTDVVPKFLGEALASERMQRRLAVECFSGSTNQVELNREALLGLSVMLPPLAEQRKIAAILSSIDDAIEATQAVIDQLQVVRTAMLDELLTRGLPGRHTRFKKTEIGEVPEDWEVARLRDLSELITKGTTPTTYGHSYTATGVPFLRVENVSDDHRLLLDDVRFVGEATHRSLALLPQC